MSSYLSFPFTYQHDLDYKEYLCVFKTDSVFNCNELCTFLETNIKKYNFTDQLLLIASASEFQEIIISLGSNEPLKIAFQRFNSSLQKIHIVRYNIDGQIDSVFNLYTNSEVDINSAEMGRISNALKEQGLVTICKQNDVINIAPYGAQFRKLSGNESIDFIRASDFFCNGDAEVSFLAFCLLPYLKGGIEFIYIDTMAISPVIYKAIGLKFQKDAIPHVVSFHSYEGLKNLSLINPEKSIFVISASSSGGMVQKLIEDSMWAGVPKERIITLFSYVEPSEGTILISNISSLKPKENRREKDLSNIQIVGEFFSSTYKAPKEVMIRAVHACPQLKKKIENFYNKDVFQISDTLSLKDSSLVEQDFFKCWLKNALNYFAPINVSHIVYAGKKGSGSEQFAEKVKQHYQEATKKTFNINFLDADFKKPIIVSSENLKSIYDSDDKRGVVIVSESISDGGNELLSISRDLRNFSPSSPRSYFIGVLFSPTNNDLETLKPSLTYSPNRMKYNFNSFWEIPIGPSNDFGPWKMEADFLKNSYFENSSLIQTRLKFLRSRISKGLGENCFWHNVQGSKLKLRKDFVFWSKGYSCEEVKAASVLITISNTLQNLRDGKNISLKDRLFSNEYQPSLISPDCFNRFNDGIIQASLLRGAMPREMDYSISSRLSQNMKDIFLRIMNGALSDYGEAFPEFLIAWVTGRLRFTEDDNKVIIKEILNSKLPNGYKLLVQFFEKNFV